MNGGYVMIKATDTELYKKLNVSLELGKPILFYEDDNTCYYIDTITKAEDIITLTKGGKTIEVASDGTITESGSVQNHLYNYAITCDGTEIDTPFTIFIQSNKKFEDGIEITFTQLLDLIYIGVLGKVGEVNDSEIIGGGIYNISDTNFDILIPKNTYDSNFDMNIQSTDLDNSITIYLIKQLF